ncbi:ASTRA-associated protein 1 [Termitomyces sp. T112]|nr:ASTRA-associated protein 1 [Termitomyces sp. T112]
MTAPQPPATPTHLLRTHSCSITTVFVSYDNERIYSGDTSGLVVVTSTRSLRPITKWNPHTDSLLGIEEWGNRVITHARDNKLHVWTRVEELSLSARVGSVAQSVGEQVLPNLCYSMDVNALNYCRFSLLPYTSDQAQALVALPNLVDSTSADIWNLPSCERIHAAVGQAGKVSLFNSNPVERSKTGIIMSLHIFKAPQDEPSSSTSNGELRLLCAYESGSVTLRRYARADKATSLEGAGWEVIWDVKVHAETIMAMRVSRNNSFALTVSADHLVGRYDLGSNDGNTACVLHRTKHPGNAAIAIHDNERVCVVAGWDGSLRLHSTRTMKLLGTLKYHKTSCQAAEFAHSLDAVTTVSVDQKLNNSDDDEEMGETEKEERARWLIAGGKDNRVSIWTLIDFVK